MVSKRVNRRNKSESSSNAVRRPSLESYSASKLIAAPASKKRPNSIASNGNRNSSLILQKGKPREPSVLISNPTDSVIFSTFGSQQFDPIKKGASLKDRGSGNGNELPFLVRGPLEDLPESGESSSASSVDVIKKTIIKRNRRENSTAIMHHQASLQKALLMLSKDRDFQEWCQKRLFQVILKLRAQSSSSFRLLMALLGRKFIGGAIKMLSSSGGGKSGASASEVKRREDWFKKQSLKRSPTTGSDWRVTLFGVPDFMVCKSSSSSSSSHSRSDSSSSKNDKIVQIDSINGKGGNEIFGDLSLKLSNDASVMASIPAPLAPSSSTRRSSSGSKKSTLLTLSIPEAIAECLSLLHCKRAHYEPGIFRISGSNRKVEELYNHLRKKQTKKSSASSSSSKKSSSSKTQHSRNNSASSTSTSQKETAVKTSTSQKETAVKKSSGKKVTIAIPAPIISGSEDASIVSPLKPNLYAFGVHEIASTLKKLLGDFTSQDKKRGGQGPLLPVEFVEPIIPYLEEHDSEGPISEDSLVIQALDLILASSTRGQPGKMHVILALAAFFKLVRANEKVTNMPASNLAIIFTPYFFNLDATACDPSSSSDQKELAGKLHACTRILEILIERVGSGPEFLESVYWLHSDFEGEKAMASKPKA